MITVIGLVDHGAIIFVYNRKSVALQEEAAADHHSSHGRMRIHRRCSSSRLYSTITDVHTLTESVNERACKRTPLTFSLFSVAVFLGPFPRLGSRLKTTRSGGESSANFDKVRRLSAGTRRDATRWRKTPPTVPAVAVATDAHASVNSTAKPLAFSLLRQRVC